MQDDINRCHDWPNNDPIGIYDERIPCLHVPILCRLRSLQWIDLYGANVTRMALVPRQARSYFRNHHRWVWNWHICIKFDLYCNCQP